MIAEHLPAGSKLGALVNPNSRRNRRRPPDLEGVLATGMPVETPSDVDEVHDALARLAAADVDVVAISGGDGAVLAAMTAILIDGPFARPPILCLLPAGTTNMTAADAGYRGKARDLVGVAQGLKSVGGGIETRRTVSRDQRDRPDK